MKKVLICLLIWFIPAISTAALKTYKPSGHSQWGINENWSPVNVPTATDTVLHSGDSANFNDSVLATGACCRLKFDNYTSIFLVNGLITMTVAGSYKFIDITGTPLITGITTIRCNIGGTGNSDTNRIA
jgi:hypothetical protein